jgi:hypothetical protein
MTRTTRAQRRAIFSVFKRGPLFKQEVVNYVVLKVAMSYRDFRAQVMPTYGCDGAVVVPWHGMWLCIEADGYTHS